MDEEAMKGGSLGAVRWTSKSDGDEEDREGKLGGRKEGG